MPTYFGAVEDGVWLHFPRSGPIYFTEFSELHNYQYLRVLVNYEDACKLKSEYQFGGQVYVWNKQIDGTLYVISNVRIDEPKVNSLVPFVYLFLQRLNQPFDDWHNTMPANFIPSHMLNGHDSWGGGTVNIKSIEFFKYKTPLEPEIKNAWYHLQRFDGASDHAGQQDANEKTERPSESE